MLAWAVANGIECEVGKDTFEQGSLGIAAVHGTESRSMEDDSVVRCPTSGYRERIFFRNHNTDVLSTTIQQLRPRLDESSRTWALQASFSEFELNMG